MLGVLISLNKLLFFDIVDVKLFWNAFNCRKRKLIADYFKKQQRILEGCLGMLFSKSYVWCLFAVLNLLLFLKF